MTQSTLLPLKSTDTHAPSSPIAVHDFLASLRNRTASGISTIALDGGELPVSVRLRKSPAVIFTFSGAVDREKHDLPRFATSGLFSYVPASIIGLSDPTLDRKNDLKIGWYAGHEGFELQKILPDLLSQIVESLKASRVAFVGSSGGGFAALYYSWHIPRSVAIVSNPQTNLNRYLVGPVEKYRAECWPQLESNAPLDLVIDADLGALYAEQFPNTVIYLQAASDHLHITRDFASFVSRLPREHASRLIVRMEHWGRWGHKPVPPEIWIPWMRAAIASPKPSAASIQATWADEYPIQLPTLEPLKTAPQRDEQIAAELARAASEAVVGADACVEQSL